MIPKIIHYCWFGKNKKTKEVELCINSWKKYCRDYEIIEWNDSNYHLDKNKFISNAYSCKQYAFVSDYARLDVIYNYGGIYLDTDVELIKNLDNLLNDDLYAGFENNDYVAFGLGFGAAKGHPFLKEMLDIYNGIDFINNFDDLKKITCPKIQTYVLEKNGLIRNGKTQKFNNITIYSPEYFCPKSYETGLLKISGNTYSIHHYSMNWLSSTDKFFKRIDWVLVNMFGNKVGKTISAIVTSPLKTVRIIYKSGINEGIAYFVNNTRYYLNEKRNDSK